MQSEHLMKKELKPDSSNAFKRWTTGVLVCAPDSPVPLAERYLPAPSPTLRRKIAESTFRPCGVGPVGDNQHPDVTDVTRA
jgi:hypothetical protein